ncbi:hypothetical protein [Sphingomonas sp. BK235]|uniref:hypothetical protein n=1 Tax=Sphingomonas sp. BK235 TaxID=2512131 RepID=UPI001047B388|nr:hypothetical protein [Sphingomonas sp. BK235]TCP33283.1 hypothetical protein EV292_106225 [Sphingomonas sp. BK235]
MTDTPTASAVVVAPAPARVTWHGVASLVVSALTFLVTLFTIVFYGGQLTRQVGDNERRTTQLEQRADRADSETRDLGKIVARVDAKLDLLLARSPARD